MQYSPGNLANTARNRLLQSFSTDTVIYMFVQSVRIVVVYVCYGMYCSIQIIIISLIRPTSVHDLFLYKIAVTFDALSPNVVL